ncbi:MAG: HAD family hydrolase [Nanoarchaeota archaeon]|nr:HAD family hydrolase [Nanoarchaeota archaeon]
MKDKYIFLDMDGVIIVEKDLLYKKEDVELLPRSDEAIKLLNNNNYRPIVITNKPIVARGLCSFDDVIELHSYIEGILAKKNAKIEKIYFCPHHPKKGDNPQYTRECECRKPKAGMIFEARRDYGIDDLSSCYVIGDKTSDILAGKNAGCRTILVKTGYGGDDGFKDATPDYEARDLYEAVQNIVLKK